MVRLRRICHPEARCQSGDEKIVLSSVQCRSGSCSRLLLGFDVAGARVTGNGDRRMRRVGIAPRLAIAATTAATHRATTPAALRVAFTPPARRCGPIASLRTLVALRTRAAPA